MDTDKFSKPYWTEARKASWERNHEKRVAANQRRKGTSYSNKGKPASEKRLQAIQALADARRNKPQSEAHKKKSGAALLKKYAEDPAFRERQRIAHTDATTNPVVRKKNSLAQLKRFEDPEVREANMKQLEEIMRQRSSSREDQVAGLLDALRIVYQRQYRVSECLVDFYVPDRNLLIEVNGCYWHRCEKCGYEDRGKKRQSDINRYYFLRGQGYNLYVLWEHDILESGVARAIS